MFFVIQFRENIFSEQYIFLNILHIVTVTLLYGWAFFLHFGHFSLYQQIRREVFVENVRKIRQGSIILTLLYPRCQFLLYSNCNEANMNISGDAAKNLSSSWNISSRGFVKFQEHLRIIPAMSEFISMFCLSNFTSTG